MTDDNIVDLEAPYGRKKDGTPKKPSAWQQRGRGKVEPRGLTIGDSKGPGWGGPAKGAGRHDGSGGRPTKAISAMKAEERAALEQEMLELKLKIAHNGEFEATRLAAINSIENRLLGLPQGKIAHVGGDEDDNPINSKITVEFVRARP